MHGGRAFLRSVAVAGGGTADGGTVAGSASGGASGGIPAVPEAIDGNGNASVTSALTDQSSSMTDQSK